MECGAANCTSAVWDPVHPALHAAHANRWLLMPLLPAAHTLRLAFFKALKDWKLQRQRQGTPRHAALPCLQCGRLSVIGDYAGWANHFQLGVSLREALLSVEQLKRQAVGGHHIVLRARI